MGEEVQGEAEIEVTLGLLAAKLKESMKDTPTINEAETRLSGTSICSAVFAVGDRVEVVKDGDGATGLQGVVSVVWPSGRCTVTFPDKSFRSLSSDTLRQA